MNVLMKSLAAAALAAALACTAARAESAEKVTVALNFIVTGSLAPLYTAKEKGWYDEAGLDVTLQPTRGSAESLKFVGTGAADVGLSDASVVAKAISDNAIPVVAIGSYFQDLPAAIISYADSAIGEPKDLVGKKIALSPGDASAALLDAFLELNGVKPDDVEKTVFNFGTMVPAMLAGQVDATTGFVTGEVLTARAGAKERGIDVMRFADYGMNSYSIAFIANKDFAQAKPEVVSAFLKATFRGLDYAIAHPEEAAEFLSRHTETTREDLLAQWNATIPLVDTPEARSLGWGTMTEGKWRSTQGYFVDAGLQTSEVPADDLFTNAFLAEGQR